MIKLVLTAILSAAIGIGLGLLQSSVMDISKDERFVPSREGIAEQKKEVTRDEILGSMKGRPVLEVVGDIEYDFGSMMHGTSMSHDFLVKNSGEGPLVLEMGESSCKCTVGDLDSSILKPGEETKVTLTWKAQAVMRDFGQSATIKTNDPDQTEVKFSIFGDITRSIVIVPDALEIGNISDSEEVNRNFYVLSYLDGTESLTDLTWTADSSREFVELQAEKIEAKGLKLQAPKGAKSAFEVSLKLKQGLAIGPFASRIQFGTNHGEDVRTLELPVNGRVTGIIELQGGPSFDTRNNLLDLGNVSSSKGAKVTLLLFIRGEQRDEIIPEVDSVVPEDALQATVGKVKKSATRNVYPVTFEVPKGAPEAYYPARGNRPGGIVLIKTKGAVERTLRVNIRLNVKK